MDRKRYSLIDYNKKEAFQDATRFFIVYEGEKKEPKYFETFNHLYLNRRTAYIHHVFESDTKVAGSQPKKLIERAEAFINDPPKDLEITPSKDDKFRFVLDVDEHPIEQFAELKSYCERLYDADLYISNYCFEVWLWFHMDGPDSIVCRNSAEMKTQLGTKHTEHKMNRYPKSYLEIEKINEAILVAEAADTNKEHYFPVEKSTKVYLLMKELLEYSIENKTVKEPKIL